MFVAKENYNTYKVAWLRRKSEVIMTNRSVSSLKRILFLAVLFCLSLLPACKPIADIATSVMFTTVGSPVSVPDGEGGVYVAYQKNVRGLGRITYMQRLDAAGSPIWPGSGPRIYLERIPGYARSGLRVGELVALEDGAILVWSLGEEIWAQRVDLMGKPLWDQGGIQVSTSFPASDEGLPRLLRAVNDGRGRVVIAANRSDLSGVALRRLYASGVLSGIEGVSVPPGFPETLELAQDKAGNVFILWSQDIFWGIQKVSADGQSEWGVDGIIPFAEMPGVLCESLVSDGEGGVIVLCETRPEAAETSAEEGTPLIVQHFDAQGEPLWQEEGLSLGALVEAAYPSALVTDGAGGAVVAWQSASGGIDSQRVSGEGQLLWGPAGVEVLSEKRPFSLAAGSEPGEALIVWTEPEHRNNNVTVIRLWAQKLSADGSLVWDAAGTAFTALESASTSLPQIFANDKGDAWVTWTAGRSSGGHHQDTTYIQLIAVDGQPLLGEDGLNLSDLR